MKVVLTAKDTGMCRRVFFLKDIHTAVFEQGGVAVRVRLDPATRRFAVEDVTAEEAKGLVDTLEKS